MGKKETTQQIETESTDIIAEEIKEELIEIQGSKHWGVEFPAHFPCPRWIQLPDKSFALAFDTEHLTAEMKANWNSKYIPELASLGKQVLENLTKTKIGPD